MPDCWYTHRQRIRREDTENIKLFSMRSGLLSDFFGRPIEHLAGVVLPPGHDRGRPLPICYSVHGFGGSHRAAWRRGPELVRKMTKEGYPRMIYVFLNAQIPMGHRVFADSVNCGPWGTAFEKELAPAIEKRFGGPGTGAGRFVTGHSSGGWASLWMQVTHPDFFGGVWSTAPDPVDFRDFTGVDIYRNRNAFQTPAGEPIQLMRRKGRFVMTLEDFVRMEVAQSSYGGQFFSFDAVFSPKGDDGRPMPLFSPHEELWPRGMLDRIHHEMAARWRSERESHR